MAGGMSTLLVTSTAAKPNPLDRSVVALAPSPVSARPSTPSPYIETTCRKVRSSGHASPPELRHGLLRKATMPQESTLLAYLVPRLTSRVEDTATDAIAFILNRSPTCRDALGLLLREGEGSYHVNALTSFDTQVTYKDGSRPDMVGYDQGGGKRLLVESKFWATLLEGQASSYFDQLEDAEGRGCCCSSLRLLDWRYCGERSHARWRAGRLKLSWRRSKHPIRCAGPG